MGSDFQRGMDLLGEVARPAEPADASMERDDRDRRATSLAWLGWAYLRLPSHRAQARGCFERAVELSPDNPYHLVAFVELDVIASGTDEYLSLLAPSLRQAAGHCEEHLRAGIEVTRAWLTLAKLRFLLNDPFSAFDALCLGSRFAEKHHPLLDLVRSFEQLKDAIGARRAAIDWLCAGAQLLCRAKERNSVDDAAKFNWSPLVGNFSFEPSMPATILAGATASAESARVAAYEPLLCDGLAGQKNTLISGGTTGGVQHSCACGSPAQLPQSGFHSTRWLPSRKSAK